MTEKSSELEIAYALMSSALAAIAKRDSNRDLLESGSSHQVDVTISGTVDGVSVEISRSGELVIGVDNPSGSTRRPKLDVMLANCFDVMAKTRRERLIQLWDEKGIKPGSEDSTQIVKALLSNHSTKTNKRGAVQFQESE